MIFAHSGGGGSETGSPPDLKKVTSISKRVGEPDQGAPVGILAMTYDVSFFSGICFVVKHLLKESWKWSILKNHGITE